MQVLNLELCIPIANIALEGTVSQIFYIGPSSFSSFFIKCRKNSQKNNQKIFTFFDIK